MSLAAPRNPRGAIQRRSPSTFAQIVPVACLTMAVAARVWIATFRIVMRGVLGVGHDVSLDLRLLCRSLLLER